jgi:hypothetical protein
MTLLIDNDSIFLITNSSTHPTLFINASSYVEKSLEKPTEIINILGEGEEKPGRRRRMKLGNTGWS